MSNTKSILFLAVLVIVSVTLYFQNESPGEDKQTNRLPVLKGDFS